MITMTEETWDELCSMVHALAELATEWCDDREQAAGVKATCVDVDALIAEIDDANTRERYMALAAKDQLGLFDVEGVAI